MAFAEKTTVTVAKSKAEIEHLLEKYGAESFLSGWKREEGRAFVAFEYKERHYRIEIPVPLLTDDEFWHTPTGKKRTETQAKSAHDQVCRQRWRAMLLLLKANLEAVDMGLLSFEQAFLSNTVTPSGQTIGEALLPQLDKISRGDMPPLLPGPVQVYEVEEE